MSANNAAHRVGYIYGQIFCLLMMMGTYTIDIIIIPIELLFSPINFIIK